MERTIHAPDKEWLDESEAAAWLGMKSATFLRLVRNGILPPGRVWSARTVVWSWRTVWAISHMAEIGFLAVDAADDPEFKVVSKPVKQKQTHDEAS